MGRPRKKTIGPAHDDKVRYGPQDGDDYVPGERWVLQDDSYIVPPPPKPPPEPTMPELLEKAGARVGGGEDDGEVEVARFHPHTLGPLMQTSTPHCVLTRQLKNGPTGPATSTHFALDGLESASKRLRVSTQSALMTVRASSPQCISMTALVRTQ